MSELDRELADELTRWEQAGRRRRLPPVSETPTLPHDFVSNDLLGLSRHPRVIEASRAALAEHGAGAGAASLLGGRSSWHDRAESDAARWLGTEAALLFPSGYQANVGVVGALAGRGDVVVSDRLVHASLIDAARLSRARVLVHDHLDLEHLERRLRQAEGARRRLVLTEGVFSMDGDLAPLRELHSLCVQHDAWLIVDEAHAVGVLGPGGAGAWSALGSGANSSRLAARVVTGGKALGVAGALVVGDASLRDLLLHRARSFVFTTAPPPSVAAGLVAAMELAAEADDARRHLRGLARSLAERLDLPAPDAAIVPVPLGDETRALRIEATLRERGFDLRAVRPPTVPVGGSRLRITCHAFNDEEEVTVLAEALAEVGAVATEATSTDDESRLAETLVVVGTDTEAGKTVVSSLLMRALRQLGPALYWKPVQTGSDDDTTTVTAAAGLEPAELAVPAWRLAKPASPHEAAAEENVVIDVDDLSRRLVALRERHADRRLLLELAGGLLVPLNDRQTQADWLAELGLPVILVARSGLGTLNHSSLTLEALRARGLEPRALFLVGPHHVSNHATLRDRAGVPAVFELPPLPEVSAEHLDAWLAEEGERLKRVLSP
ncbi:MAG: dethiobiotin synthase [Acidobacteriota bacterium]